MVAVAPATRSASNERAIASWLLICCAMIFFMVVIGGITRLTESGLSITQWHPIEGVLPPLSEAQWENAFARYKAIPQYEAVHPDMSLAQFKHIYFWEYFHRLWGRLIGAAFLLPFLYFLLRGRIARPLVPKLAGLFVLGGLQGLLGWYMVMSGLETRIEVSQYRLAAHLGMAVVIYLAMLWVALDLLLHRAPSPSSSWPGLSRPSTALRQSRSAVDARHNPRDKVPGGGHDGVGAESVRPFRIGATVILLLVFITVIAGAFVAGTRAGYIDNTFPLMEGHLVPPGYWHLAPWWRNWFENLAAVQFDHRVLAITTWCAIALLWAASLRARLSPLRHWLFHALFFFACLQVALGISTLLLVVALPVAVAHQAGAMLLITAALVARHSLRRG